MIDSLDKIFSRHGLPVTIKSDNGPQFKSKEFEAYCVENKTTHLKVTAKRAQANGEVKRQNASLLKRIRIAQAEGKPWTKELRKYVTLSLTQERSLPHNTTGRTPAELLYKLRGKLPDLGSSRVVDHDLRDRDSEAKGKSKIYADMRRGACYSEVEMGDRVLVQQEKTNKLSTPFNPTPLTVVSKTGNSLVIEADDGAQYSRNTSLVRKFLEPESENVRSDPRLHHRPKSQRHPPTQVAAPSTDSSRSAIHQPKSPRHPPTQVAAPSTDSGRSANHRPKSQRHPPIQVAAPSTEAPKTLMKQIVSPRCQRERRIPKRYEDFVCG